LTDRLTLPTEVSAPLVLHGDCLDLLAGIPDASIDVVITDPPAAVAFMGKDWDRFDKYKPRTARGREISARLGRDDLIRRAANLLLGLSLSERTEDLPAREEAAALAAELRERATSPAPLPPWAIGFVAFMVDVWSEVDRVLKPGAFVCAWALPKTADLAGLAMRAVGWGVEESVLHLFGCLSDDAEILTEYGWLSGQQMHRATLALCYDVDSGIYQWRPIEHRVRFRHVGRAYRIVGEGTDHTVTPDHRCVDIRRGFITAEQAASQQALHVPIPDGLHGLRFDVASDGALADSQGQDVRQGLCGRVDPASEDGPHEQTQALRDLRCALLAAEPTTELSLLLAPLLRGLAEQGPGDPATHASHICFGSSSDDARGSRSWCVEDDGSPEPRLEGRPTDDAVSHASDHGAVPGGVWRDGSKERVCVRAPAGDGASDRPAADAVGGCPPHRPQHAEQRHLESHVVRHEHGPQVVRVARGTSAAVGRFEAVEFDGFMWCVTVPTGAFVARSNGMPFVTGNSGMSKAGDLGKKIDKLHGAEREVTETVPDRWAGKGVTLQHATEEPRESVDLRLKPATEAAKRWTDWSTQLAPGHEQWLIAQKPLTGCTPERLREVTGLDYAWSSRELKNAKARAWAASRWPGHDLNGCTHWTGRSLRPGHPSIMRLIRDGEIVAEQEGAKYSRAPITSDVVQVLAHGCGAMNIGACRVPRGEGERAEREAAATGGSGLARGTVYGDANETPAYTMASAGSWPKNVVLTEGGERCPVAELDRQSGCLGAGHTPRRPASAFAFGSTDDNRTDGGPNNGHGDSGGASRYFTRFGLPLAPGDSDAFGYFAKNSDRRAGTREDIINDHPTPKSIELMSWLVRLLAAKAEHTGGAPAIVLDPFGGSGTTAVACIAEQVRCVIIERDAKSIEITRARIAAAVGDPEAAAEANAVAPTGAQLTLI
jgi:DNA modification methylase